MTTNTSGPTRFLNAPGPRRVALGAVAILLTATAASGCSSSDGGDVDEFVGTWSIDVETSHFTLTCPFLDGPPLAFPLWSTVRLEEGTLSDLVELGGPCPTYYDIVKKGVADMRSPDPFTKQAPFCRIDESTDTVTGYLEFQFTSWGLRHLAPVKGQPPQGQMIGSANVPLITIDADGVPQPDPGGDCSYVVNASLTKIGK